MLLKHPSGLSGTQESKTSYCWTLGSRLATTNSDDPREGWVGGGVRSNSKTSSAWCLWLPLTLSILGTQVLKEGMGETDPLFYPSIIWLLPFMSQKHCFLSVSVHSACCDKNTITWVAYKQQKFISHSLEAAESKVKMQTDWFWWGHFSWTAKLPSP